MCNIKTIDLFIILEFPNDILGYLLLNLIYIFSDFYIIHNFSHLDLNIVFVRMCIS